MKRIKPVDVLRKWSLVFVIIILGALFQSFQPRFLSFENTINIIRQASILGVLAFGLAFVIICGEMDLSFSMVATLSAITALYLEILKVNTVFSWFLVLCIGIVCGIINAFIVVRLRLPSMLATIGTQLFFGGIAAWLARGATIWTSKFGRLFTIPGRGMFFGLIPVAIFIWAFVAVLSTIVLEKTVWGRYFYAVGGNANAADHAGISTKRVKAQSLVIMGFLASVAGIMMASQYASATPTVGSSFLFPAIIAVFLGSIFLKDGVPNAWGTLVGCLFISILSNGFNLIGLKYWHEDTTKGVLMILAISITVVAKNRRK
jgi:ribose/xylose/arabinose/galactoside ABC-type transport system permease subunit